MADLASITSLLFVPGHRPDRFAKAAGAGAGAIILDLEDAVAPEDKPEARKHVVEWLEGGNGGSGVVVRINPPGTPWYADDLKAVAGHVVMLPKAETAQQVADVAAATGAGVVPLIETAAGVLNAHAILSVPGVVRAAFGSIDLSAQLGVDPNDHQAFLAARSHLVLASGAAGVGGPIDGVTVDVKDEARLTSDSRHGASLGFTAKMCIHPAQLEVVHTTFRPTEDEIVWAKRVVEAAGGGAVTTLDGKMVDKPVVDRARRMLERVAE
ncbi:MAG: HpcH/HpaI aldolase/citrate lyase family protein [Sporichthyaceae bacterium]